LNYFMSRPFLRSRTSILVTLSFSAACAWFAVACGPGTSPGEGNGNGDGDGDIERPGDGDGDGDDIEVIDPVDDGSGGSKGVAMLETVLPAGFTAGTTAGGFKVEGSLADYEAPEDNSCVNVLNVVVRDFTQAHIDFGQEKPVGWAAPGLYTGQVLAELGEDRKPVINPARTPLDVIEGFEDWYTTIAGVNEPYLMKVWLEPDPLVEGNFIFDVNNFFPLDDHNTSPADVQVGGDGEANGPHNFLFTTEIHTAFAYKGGEVFAFRGDDDVFVYINNQLVVDLGGIHGPVEGSVQLDAQAAALGLEIGQVYTLDMFQAERNPGGSNFQISTSLDFQECGVLPVDLVVK
jgi:fibro-slime domain-containing protein